MMKNDTYESKYPELHKAIYDFILVNDDEWRKIAVSEKGLMILDMPFHQQCKLVNDVIVPMLHHINKEYKSASK